MSGLSTLFFAGFVAISLCASARASAIMPFGTGTTETRSMLSGGTADSHYMIVSSPDQTFEGMHAMVVTPQGFPAPYWVANGPAARWIGPAVDAAGGVMSGTYVYRTTFTLGSLYDASTATLLGNIAADNQVTIWLNGHNTGIHATRYNELSAFRIASNFVVGVNTLDFVVYNAFGPTPNTSGLYVNFVSSPSELVPERRTSILAVSGLLFFIGLWRSGRLV